MNYELAKKLRDAGFPQPQDSLVYIGGRIPNEEFINMPTLEQLIEECGSKFNNLTERGGTWACNYEIYDDDPYYVEGATPIEAVANLWLKINNK